MDNNARLGEKQKKSCYTGKRSVCFLPAQHSVLSTRWVSVEEAGLDYYSFADSGSHFTSQAFRQRQQIRLHK